MDFERRVTALIVCKKDEPVFSEYATRVEIVDEAAGEFIEVSQPARDGVGGKIAIGSDEWPAIRDAIDELLSNCRDSD
jgi:hypothetical protein